MQWIVQRGLTLPFYWYGYINSYNARARQPWSCITAPCKLHYIIFREIEKEKFSMKKDNVKIKDKITYIDDINVITSIVPYYFDGDEYTPYYSSIAQVTAIALYYLEGISFEADDFVYDLVMSPENDDVFKLIRKFLFSSVNKADTTYYQHMVDIMEQVDDIVDFEKQKRIHNTKAFSIVGEMCEAVLDVISNFANLNINALTPENIEMAKTFMEKLKDKEITRETLADAVRDAADQFKMPENDVIEGQRQRIAEQQTQLQEKEAEIQELRKWKRDHESRKPKTVKGSGKTGAKSTGNK